MPKNIFPTHTKKSVNGENYEVSLSEKREISRKRRLETRINPHSPQTNLQLFDTKRMDINETSDIKHTTIARLSKQLSPMHPRFSDQVEAGEKTASRERGKSFPGED